MHPRLIIPLTGIELQSHDAMVALAATVAGLLGYRWITRDAVLDAPRVAWALAMIAVVTLLGGRLHFALANWSLYRDSPWRVLSLSSAGLHAPGAILGAVLGSLVVLPLLRIPLARFADALAPAIGVGIAVARLGCFLHGCCYGGLCPYPWAVTLPADSFVYALQVEAGILPGGAPRSLPIHPLPLYFAAASLAISALLVWRQPRKRYAGELALWLLFLFFLTSAGLEPLRADDPMRVYWGRFPQLLWVNGVLALLCGALLLLAARRAAAGRSPAR